MQSMNSVTVAQEIALIQHAVNDDFLEKQHQTDMEKAKERMINEMAFILCDDYEYYTGTTLSWRSAVDQARSYLNM